MPTPEELQYQIDQLRRENYQLNEDKKRLNFQLKRAADTGRFGLHWLDVPEDFGPEAANALPILKEVKDRAVSTPDGKPTHVLIEGENYHALQCLNYTHKGKVDVIYIDPPYNTGSDGFRYRDKRLLEEYPDGSPVQKDSPLRHSYWLSFMHKRLELAKNLLRDSGVIFISIDDNEQAQLKLLCDEVFGEENFVGTLVWEKKKKGSHLNNSITNIKEYVIVYAKRLLYFDGLIAEVITDVETYPCINPGNTLSVRTIKKGTKSNFLKKEYFLPSGTVISAGNMELTLRSDLVIQDGKLKQDLLMEGEWRYTSINMDQFALNDELYLTNQLYVRRIVRDTRFKRLKDILQRVDYEHIVKIQSELIDGFLEGNRDAKFIEEKILEIAGIENSSVFDIDLKDLYKGGWGSNEDGDEELRSILGAKKFGFPKPSKLLIKLLASLHNKNATILDFFAGSGTILHATLSLNEQDGGNRQCILVTNNENNIAEEVCYERNRRVMQGYTNAKGQAVAPLGNSLNYYRVGFIGQNHPQRANDEDLLALAYHAGELLALAENTLHEIRRTDAWQLFTNQPVSVNLPVSPKPALPEGEQTAISFDTTEPQAASLPDVRQYTAIYFQEDLAAFEPFCAEVQALTGPVTVYVFSWGEGEFDFYFEDYPTVVVKTIPQPILDIYRNITTLTQSTVTNEQVQSA